MSSTLDIPHKDPSFSDIINDVLRKNDRNVQLGLKERFAVKLGDTPGQISKNADKLILDENACKILGARLLGTIQARNKLLNHTEKLELFMFYDEYIKNFLVNLFGSGEHLLRIFIGITTHTPELYHLVTINDDAKTLSCSK